MKKTVLCHVNNEEYFLPWWLNHHKQMFDHGIIIDYRSTDRTVEIVKEICPTWDVITSRNTNFQADLVDIEVMNIEQHITGWRICLNVTEFLVGNYSLMSDVPSQQILVPSLFFVDNEPYTEVDQSIPLWDQKKFGFSFKDSLEAFAERRARSLHNVPVQYPVPGRHYPTYTTEDLCIFYFGWSPFNDKALARKLQIQQHIPLIDRQRQWGFHHLTNKETLEYRLENEFIPRSRDISKDIEEYVAHHLSNLL